VRTNRALEPASVRGWGCLRGRRSFNRWREYDPEATARCYALRLHEAGIIKSNPQRIIATSADWRFLNELKKELKGRGSSKRGWAPPASSWRMSG
jgi:hypothetical protein